MNIKPTKVVIIAVLLLLALGWVSLMGLVGVLADTVRSSGGSHRGPYTDDGAIKAEITYVRNEDFKITLSLKVTDRNGEVLGGLDRADFEVTENDFPVGGGNFYPAGQAPVRVCLVMDYSNSMNSGKPTRKIDGAKAAALGLLDMLKNETDYLGLYFFNYTLQKTGTDERLAMGPLSPERREKARSTITSTDTANGTPMYAVMDKAMQALKSVSGRRVMVVLGDGLDTNYKGPRQDEQIKYLSGKAVEMNFPIHMVSLPTGKFDEAGMRQLAEKSKGTYIAAGSPDDLKKIFMDVGQALQKEYVLEYTSPDPVENGIKRNVVVTIRKGPSGTQAKADYPVGGVVATGAARRPTDSTGAGIEAAPPPSVPFAAVFFPLAVLLALLFAVPYFGWLGRRNSSPSLLAGEGQPNPPAEKPRRPVSPVPPPPSSPPPPDASGPEAKLW
jgi:Mg-chelatase subunit ChlD